MSDKPSFVLYMDLLAVIDEMDDAQAARLFRLIKAYNELESESPDIREAAKAIYSELLADPVLRIIFAPFRKRFEADKKRYAEMIEANRKNGRKGGAPKGNRNAAKKQDADVTEVTETTETSDRLILDEETTEITDRLKKQPKQPKTSETSETSRYDMICNDNNIISSNEENNIVIKETNKEKAEKKNFASSVRLTQAEYDHLVAEYGEEGAREIINILNDYKEANGKKYKSDAAAIRNWVIDRFLEKRAKQNGNGRQQTATAPRGYSELRDPSTETGRYKSTL